ncbi:urea ABC transporter permease subunit UrtB [Thauera sp. CAU 1555]|uniref:Urea ABC transporter permease subunit UrtB n=1 Tax=Thauera sedimentorum TaxID=2767595 RepID=A0ABR9B9M3_9RHOO|nr:urea ABC transporter permease subunit UrtB [Thauera sedimentorum]MBC9071213.1 urea ABC transporter permease subunit UrtB [Thauera sedimentorum]MBD8502132.1 urea ABC transporter permease subunit UrtB [Thauera sedimentorum]
MKKSSHWTHRAWLILPLLAALFLLMAAGKARAALDEAALQQLATGDFGARIAAIEAIGAGGGEDARRLIAALEAGELGVLDGRVVILTGGTVTDAASGATLEAAANAVDTLRVNNRVRRAIGTAKAALDLTAGERDTRLAAANTLRDNASETLLPVLERALETEQDEAIRDIVLLAAARVNLNAAEPAKRLKAVSALGQSSDPAVRTMLEPFLLPANEPDALVREAAADSINAIERRVAFAQHVGTVFSGLSLGSILLLAALGLAITYGVMGVINMAHGELLMIGAYAAYLVQGLFRTHLPEWVDWYVVAAIPAGFFAAAAVGVLMERSVLRFLYGRPLESLLATWGISLVLIQAARVIFGPQNVELANPSWMSGGVELAAGVVLPYNRIVILGFGVFVLVLVWLMMNRTRLGMFVRAVTQNRPMAGCVGVPTARIDTLAFAIGAGIAGLGGVALSQIANVGPAMGTGYIVDSFMVVVLGGVGQLAGAVWAAMGLGIVSKFLEGWAGAVIAKILVLVFIIAFIQKRPQGIFALKGRFADS